jgi:hypothetical protein
MIATNTHFIVLLSYAVALKGFSKHTESTHYNLVSYFQESVTEQALLPPADNKYSANIVRSADGRIVAYLQLGKVRLFSAVIST